jgi:hypothetical protein
MHLDQDVLCPASTIMASGPHPQPTSASIIGPTLPSPPPFLPFAFPPPSLCRPVRLPFAVPAVPVNDSPVSGCGSGVDAVDTTALLERNLNIHPHEILVRFGLFPSLTCLPWPRLVAL